MYICIFKYYYYYKYPDIELVESSFLLLHKLLNFSYG